MLSSSLSIVGIGTFEDGGVSFSVNLDFVVKIYYVDMMLMFVFDPATNPLTFQPVIENPLAHHISHCLSIHLISSFLPLHSSSLIPPFFLPLLLELCFFFFYSKFLLT